MLQYEELLKKITDESSFTSEQIEEKVSQKIEELSGLISKQGAVHIIANELGIKFVPMGSQEIKIKELSLNKRNIDVIGRVLNVYDVRTFKTEIREGKVGSLMICDETGSARAVLWNDMANYVEKINNGDIVKLKFCYVRENNRGYKEIHLNDKSGVVVNPPGITIPEPGPKKISELSENDANAEIYAAVIDIFPPNFFELCPECMKRASLDGEKYICQTHGTVDPVKSYVVNLLVDDGSGTITVSCFKNQADRLFNNAEQFREDANEFEQQKSMLIGRMINLRGRVTINDFSQQLRFTANMVSLGEKGIDESKEEGSITQPVSKKEELNKELEELEKIKIDEI